MYITADACLCEPTALTSAKSHTTTIAATAAAAPLLEMQPPLLLPDRHTLQTTHQDDDDVCSTHLAGLATAETSAERAGGVEGGWIGGWGSVTMVVSTEIAKGGGRAVERGYVAPAAGCGEE